MRTYSVDEIRQGFTSGTDFNEIFDLFQSALAQKLKDLELYRLLFWNHGLSPDEIRLFGEKLAQEFPDLSYDVFLWLAAVFKVTTSQHDNFELAVHYYRRAALARPEECDPYTEACDCHDADLNIPPRGGLIDFLQEGLPRVSDPLPLCRHLALLFELDGKPELAEKYRRKIDDASRETRE